MRLGLSLRKHVPALFLDNSEVAFPLWAYSYLRRFERCNFVLTPYAQNVLSELRANYYRPPFSLVGKTVLDLGACCGESAWYFLEVLGAEKVYCVECDPQNIRLLKHNQAVSRLNFVVIPGKFNHNHLKLPFDFLKCDIEGGEVELLNCKLTKPCVVEVHNSWMALKFNVVGFKTAKIYKGSNYVCYIMNNYENIKQ